MLACFQDGLGVFTIIGSAAFNLLIITAVCIVSVPAPDGKKIAELGVFVMTSIWSIFAYFWMLIVIAFVTDRQPDRDRRKGRQTDRNTRADRQAETSSKTGRQTGT